MQSLAREDYLVAEVMTATPQKLQLMLLDAAIRCIERTRQHWKAEQYEDACQTLIRAQNIVGELISGLNHESESDLVKKMAAIYVCVLRHLAEAGYSRDLEKLDGALKVLKVERETWRQVCEKYSASGQSGREPADVSSRQTSAAAAGSAHTAGMIDSSIQPGPSDALPSHGFSWEA